MRRVLDNATILCGEELEAVEGHLIVEDGVIERVAEGSYLGGGKEDLKRSIVSPGFTNAHVHTGDSAGLDLGAYLSIGEKVGRDGVKYRVHKMPGSKKAIKAALSEMKKGGITAFSDFREGGVKGIELLKGILNMRARILGRPLDEEDVMPYCDGLGISSIGDYDPAQLQKMLKKRRGKLVGIHAGEARDDVERVLRIKPDFLVHLTNASTPSLEKVFKKNLPIVICPRANASFAVGFPKLKEIFESKCVVALGTDNIMANSPNMLREMEFLWKLYRGIYKDRSFDAGAVLRSATLNGRRVLNLPINSISEGNEADFIVTRRVRYAHDPILALVHRTDPDDIKEVVAPKAPGT